MYLLFQQICWLVLWGSLWTTHFRSITAVVAKMTIGIDIVKQVKVKDTVGIKLDSMIAYLYSNLSEKQTISSEASFP